MSIIEQIKQQLKSRSEDQILKEMGYHDLSKGRDKLHALLQSKNISIWLSGSHFDFHYDSRSFIKRLVRELNLSSSILDNEIEEHTKREDSLKAMKQPYIYIDTDFKRRGEPIFVLACFENIRHINIDKYIYLEYSEDQLENHIRDLISNNYREKNGTLPTWGDIKRYIYYDNHSDKSYYDTDGKKIHN